MKQRVFIIKVCMIFLLSLAIVVLIPAEFIGVEVRNYTVASHGDLYPILSIITETINKHSKNVKMYLRSTASSEESLRLAQSGEVDFFASEGHLSCKAVNGDEPFTAKLDKIRVIGWMHGNPLQIAVRGDCDITSLRDIKAKRVVVGAMDSHNTASVRTIFEIAGLSFKDLIPLYLDVTEGVEAIKKGSADAVAMQAGYPTPALVELSQSLPIRLIPMDIGIAHSIYRRCPEHILTVFPANVYNGQTKPTLVVDSPYVWGASADVPAEHVYQMLKLIKENIEEMAQADKRFEQWRFRQSCQKTGALHPGAVSFYEEMDPGCSFRLVF